MKFVMRNRGLEWMKEQIAKEYDDILQNGGIAWPEIVPEGFGGYESNPQPLGNGALLPVVGQPGSGDAAYDEWLETNVKEQKQTGYAAVTVTVDQGNLTGDQLRGLAKLAATAGDGLLRTAINQNVVLAFVPLARLPQVHAALRELGLGAGGAGQIDDVLTCPGAYTCNLGITKTMNLGAALQETVRQYDDPRVRQLTIKASGCPNACGHHWIADFGFYGNARKIDGREIPYYQMLLGGGYDDQGIMRFGLAVQSIPARLATGSGPARDRALPGESPRRRTLPRLRPALQDRDVPRTDGGPGKARRTLPRDLSGLGRFRSLFAEVRPRRVRGVMLTGQEAGPTPCQP